MRKLTITIVLLLWGMVGFSQNNQTLYGFTKIPQSLLLNPGADVNFNGYVGMPALSGIQINARSSGISIYDLFADNNVDFNVKVAQAINDLNFRDDFGVTQQLELISVGFKGNRWHENTFYSMGVYQELDAYAFWPDDPAVLFYDGNFNHIGRKFDLGQILARGELLTVFHFGINKKINKKLRVGGRAKLYNSIIEVSSINNRGAFTTELGSDNVYTQTLSVNMSVKTAGIKDLDESDNAGKTLLTRALLGGNLGLGLDVGFTYNLNRQEKIAASLQDIGFVWYTKNIENYNALGFYTYQGIELLFPQIANASSAEDYWEDLKQEIEESIVYTKNSSSYIRLRPLKLRALYSYGFGEREVEECNCLLPLELNPYRNYVGLQLYGIMRPRGPQVALTGFYQKHLFSFLDAKATFTVDKYSFSNLGLGVSSQIGTINIYAMADNILSYGNLAKANAISFQFGINYIAKPNVKKKIL